MPRHRDKQNMIYKKGKLDMNRGYTLTRDLHATLQDMKTVGRQDESITDRWRRLYRAPGGPLMGWLLDTAAARGIELTALANELGVTVGYLAQLHCGMRETANISREFAAECGVLLGVPAVVVLVVAGHLKLVDFVCATHFERWVHDTGAEERGLPAQLACGAQVGPEELRLLPQMVEALYGAASIHEVRARVR
jgi:transcriptional regulator with XRE-family HTH domain